MQATAQLFVYKSGFLLRLQRATWVLLLTNRYSCCIIKTDTLTVDSLVFFNAVNGVSDDVVNFNLPTNYPVFFYLFLRFFSTNYWFSWSFYPFIIGLATLNFISSYAQFTFSAQHSFVVVWYIHLNCLINAPFKCTLNDV